MNILFILHNPNNPFSGAVRVYQALADILRDRGHTVNLRYLEDCGLPAAAAPNLLAQRLMLPTLVSRAASRLDLGGVDVIMSSSGMAAPLFRRLRGQARRPVLINHLHGLVLYDHVANLMESQLGHLKVSLGYRLATGPFQVRWDAAGIASADHTVVQNMRDLSSVTATLGGSTGVTLLPPCVHQDLLAASVQITPIEQRDPTRIMSFGTWEARKGSYYVPAAFRRIREVRPDARLCLGGTGKPAEAILADFDPQDRAAVTVTPFLSHEEHVRMMNEHAIFLFPSLSEGFGLALAEGLCFGLAGVTTNTGFGGDFLVDGASARIVFPSAEHIARATLALMQEDTTRHRIAHEGRVIARTLTPTWMADGYERLFDSLVGRSRGATAA